ncbi:MAG: helix-turn-helix transcriptional regulator [Clostridiales bacterium]|jgi:DNA-binding Xre family transcriptional regulator|nr:helix-turn-helix transcriptional regulator [Clostridiales bacterium]
MIVYTPFWKTLKERSESTYSLINKYGISSATIDRIRHNKGISTLKLNDLCRILRCRVEDIILYVESDDDQQL